MKQAGPCKGLAQGSLAMAIVSIAIVLAVLAPVHASEPLPTLSVGIGFDDDALQSEALQKFSAVMAKADVATITAVPWQTLGASPAALIQATRERRVDVAIVPYAALTGADRRFQVLTTPFIFDDARHLERYLNSKFGDELLWDLGKLGVRGVAWWPGEFTTIAGDAAVLEPNDLIGRPLVYPSGAQASAIDRFRRMLGVRPARSFPGESGPPVSLRSSELLEGTLSQIKRLLRKPRFIALTRHLNNGFVVIANPDAWSALGDRRGKLTEQILFANSTSLWRRVVEQEHSLASVLPGTTVDLTASDRRLWQARLKDPKQESSLGTWLENARTYPDWILVGGVVPPAETSWNTWFEEGKGEDVDYLTVGRTGRINLDLGRRAYRSTAHARPDTRIAHALKSGPVDLLVMPVLLGKSLAPLPGKSLAPERISISLDNASAGDDDAGLIESLQDGRIATRAVSEALGLGKFAQWHVRAVAPGCADIGFAVWAEATLTPLDHLVVSVPVRGQDGKEVRCYGKQGSSVLRAGLETLVGQSPGDARTADAALHVFEFDEASFARSVAVLIDAQRLRASVGSDAVAPKAVFGWELQTALSEYVSGAGQLPSLITQAHRRLQHNQPLPYEGVVGDMAAVLFGGKTESDVREADAAAQAFKDVIARSAAPRVVMRLVDVGGRPIYLPLGLLAARSTTPFVNRRFTVFQTLPSSVPGPAECVGDWSVGRPNLLDGSTPEVVKLLREAATAPMPQQLGWMPTHKSLLEYFAATPSASNDRAQGLILLAHHHEGSLSYNSVETAPARIRSENIQRKFRPGSFAMLAACSTSGAGANTSAIVNRMAAQGFSSIILSPFAVDIGFGTQLALAFEQQVRAELAHPTGATAAALYDAAVQSFAAGNDDDNDVLDMALEFQLIGDPELRLCVPPKE